MRSLRLLVVELGFKLGVFESTACMFHQLFQFGLEVTQNQIRVT